MTLFFHRHAGKIYVAERNKFYPVSPKISSEDIVGKKSKTRITGYSTKRARKDEYERQKLIDKAQAMLDEPSKYKACQKKRCQ